jgi:hypothetical protein
MRLLLASILAASAALGLVACGGRVILVGSPDDGQDSGSDDGGPIEDAIVVDTNVFPPYDAQPIYDAEPSDVIIIEDDGGCLVNLEPCIYPAQCCSGICENGSCGGGPPPICLPDGDFCTGNPPCCSGPCFNGVCGEESDSGIFDDSGPISCSAPTGNACIDCLAGPCCPQLGACESDFECSQTLACFEGCYAPGMGAECSQKCNQMYPSPLAQSLGSCGAGQCAPSCD